MSRCVVRYQLMKTVSAIYEKGVFRPLEKVDLPEAALVEVIVPPHPPASDRPELVAIYDVLSERFESGIADTAARHNEHQP